MKALILNEDRQMELQEMPEPQKKDNNLIVRVKSASICGTDMRTFLKGNNKIDVPRILGHECAGEIIHSGKLGQENGYQKGDRVTVAPAVGCGHCRPCKSGHTNMCDDLKTIGFQYEGVFAPYVEIPERAIRMHNVIKLADKVDFDNATLVEPAACALNGQHFLNIGPSDNVVVYGSGLIGCIHAELALLQGADKVFILEPVEKRGKIAQKMVPNAVYINNAEIDAVEEIKKRTDGHGADVVIVAASVPKLHTEAQEIAAKLGRILLFGGLPGDGKGFIDSNLIHYKELQIFGVHATTVKYMQQILNMVEQGKLDLKKYIERILPLEEIIDGFTSIRDENVMKVVIHP